MGFGGRGGFGWLEGGVRRGGGEGREGFWWRPLLLGKQDRTVPISSSILPGTVVSTHCLYVLL
jgi:hypothetical protein